MQKIIVLVGEIGSGKGTVAQILQERLKCRMYRYSDFLSDILTRMGEPKNRDTMQQLSRALRNTFSPDIFSQVLKRDIKKDNSPYIIIDGARRREDLIGIDDLPGFLLIFIDTDTTLRYRRIVMRGEKKCENTKTYAEFLSEGESEAEKHIREFKHQAHFIIVNNHDYEHLCKEVDTCMEKIIGSYP